MTYSREENPKLTVCLDFDGVLAYYTTWNNSLGDPNPEGVKLARMLKEKGYNIVVQTCRTHPRWKTFQEEYSKVLRWLEFNNVPYDHVEIFGKAVAHVYIDDRAVHFKSNIGPAEEVFRRVVELMEELKEGVSYE